MKSIPSALRRKDPAQSLVIPAFPPPARIPESARTLLVVDDDPMVRQIETEILRLQGYTVLEAGSAAEALDVAASTATIHLLITDLAMPEADSLELTRRFRAGHPETPVLMVSGSLPLLRVQSEPDLDHFEFLAKPFQFDELLHKVRKLLGAATAAPARRAWCCD